MATAGVVLGAISVAITVVLFILFVVVGVAGVAGS